jgi:hypothetical protein
MYHASGVVPLAAGVGAGASLPFLEMSPLWLALAVFALIACASAINRILPRIVVEGQDWKGGNDVAADRSEIVPRRG